MSVKRKIEEKVDWSDESCRSDKRMKKATLKSLDVLMCKSCDSIIESSDSKMMTCEDGHPICEYCYNNGVQDDSSDGDESTCKDRKLKLPIECTECGTQYFNTNPLLGALTATVRLPCENKGCDMMLNTDKYEQHKDKCKFGNMSCPIQPEGCKWKMNNSMSISEIEAHLISHNTPTPAHPDHGVQDVVSVEKVLPIDIGREFPCFSLFSKDVDIIKYYIVPIRCTDSVVRHVLFALYLDDDGSVEVSSIELPCNSAKTKTGALHYRIRMDETSISGPIDRCNQATIEAFENDCITMCNLGDLEDSRSHHLCLVVMSGQLKSEQGWMLECLLKARRTNHPTDTSAAVTCKDYDCMGGWMIQDNILDAWPGIDARPTSDHPCMVCTHLRHNESTSNMDKGWMIAQDKLTICDSHLDTVGRYDQMLGTLKGFNVLKVAYGVSAPTLRHSDASGTPVSPYQNALVGAVGLLADILSDEHSSS